MAYLVTFQQAVEEEEKMGGKNNLLRGVLYTKVGGADTDILAIPVKFHDQESVGTDLLIFASSKNFSTIGIRKSVRLDREVERDQMFNMNSQILETLRVLPKDAVAALYSKDSLEAIRAVIDNHLLPLRDPKMSNEELATGLRSIFAPKAF
ncbi:MAG: hypothetical protein AB9915_01670 [Candidatus Dojkabacteria bacterium]